VLGPIFSRPSHFSPPRQPTAPCRSHRPVGPTSQQPQPESARVYPCHGHMGPAPSAALFAARITHPGYSRSLPETLTCGPSSSELSNLPAPNPSREPCGIGVPCTRGLALSARFLLDLGHGGINPEPRHLKAILIGCLARHTRCGAGITRPGNRAAMGERIRTPCADLPQTRDAGMVDLGAAPPEPSLCTSVGTGRASSSRDLQAIGVVVGPPCIRAPLRRTVRIRVAQT
jgi:hypothetical protein